MALKNFAQRPLYEVVQMTPYIAHYEFIPGQNLILPG